MTINIENLDKLINHLKETKPETFEMSSWLNFSYKKGWKHEPARALIKHMQTVGDCGTTACMAGHAVLLRAAEEEHSAKYYDGRVMDAAQEWLGLDCWQANELFTTELFASKRRSIETLEHLKKSALEGNPEIIW